MRLTEVETGRLDSANKTPRFRVRAAAAVVTLLLAYIGLAVGTPMAAERFGAKPAGVQQGHSAQHVAVREAARAVRAAERNTPPLGAFSPPVAVVAVIGRPEKFFGDSVLVGVVRSIRPPAPCHGFRARAPPAAHA